MVRWGIIGCGGIARRRVVPAAGEMKQSVFSAVMDVDRQAVDEVSATLGAKGYFTVQELLADPDIQAVYIATPVYLHHLQVIEAARFGKHILVEKPLALTVRQGEEMIAACRENGVFLMVGYMMKFHSLNAAAREIATSGGLGRIVFCRAQLSCWYPPIKGAWRQDPALGGGGALMDMATHCYDLLEFVTGSRIAEVCAFTDTLAHDYPVDDSSTTLLRFENGAHGVVDAFYSVPDAAGEERLEIYGTGGSILAEGTIGQSAGGRMRAFVSEHPTEYDPQQKKNGLNITAHPVERPLVDMYAAEIDYLSDCLMRCSQPDINTGEHGLHILKTALAAYESSRTGRKVAVERF